MDFVIFSSINWDDQGGAHRPTRFARALARRGQRVLFVQVPAWARPMPAENILVTSLVELGLSESQIRRSWFGFDDADLAPLARNLEAYLAQFERTETRAAIWMAPFVPFVRLLPLLAGRGYRLVYDCLDDFEAMYGLGRYFANPAADGLLTRRVDLVTTLSPALLDKYRTSLPAARVELLSGAADLEFRAREPVPDDLLRGELTLGFWGTIATDAVDVEALAYVARERPGWTLNLIGAVDSGRAFPAGAHTLSDLPNVKFIGHRPHDMLMNYLEGFDICLIPFPDNAFSRGRDPIKLYEYLAGYKPVAALHTPQLEGIPYVSVANSPSEFLAQIQAAREVEVDRSVVDEFLRANTWEASVEKLQRLIDGLPPQDAKPEGLLLPDTFANPGTLSARKEAYIAHLESTADERLAYIRELEAHARSLDAYTKKLERTHPLQWPKRVIRGTNRTQNRQSTGHNP